MPAPLAEIGSIESLLLGAVVVTNCVLLMRAWREARGPGRKWAIAILAVVGTSTLGWIAARAIAG
jgi:hypothetical protein